MSASSLLVSVVLLWSTALDLLSERSRLLAVVDAESAQGQLLMPPDCTAATDGGRCERIDGVGGCPRVTEDAKCAQRSEDIDLQQYDSGCNCNLPSTPSFCGGERARNIIASDNITFTYYMPNRKQFTAIASVKNLTGNWSYVMVMTNAAATVISDNRCTCGSTQNREVSINRTDYFKSDVDRRSIHLCLWSSSGPKRHYVHNFSIGSDCLEFINRHHLIPSHLCNQPIDGGSIKQVGGLTVRATSVPSTLQVSWSKPGIVNFLKLRGEIYYLTLNSTRGIHTFTVSDSTSVTCVVKPGLNYTVTVRTWVWCETTSCEEVASASRFIPDLTTPTPPTTSRTPPATPATDHLGPTANRYSTNVMTIVIAGSTSSVVFVFLMMIIAATILLCCKCRLKERYSYSVENPTCSARTRECSIDSASTPPVDSSSDNSVRIEDLVRCDLADHPTASMHQVPILDFQMIPMEERAQPIAEHHPDSKRVLIVGSQRVPIEDQVQLVAKPLMQYSIKILMHGVESSDMDMSERRYQRPTTTPSKWVQGAMNRAEFVVCICNEEFRDDWYYEGPEMCQQ